MPEGVIVYDLNKIFVDLQSIYNVNLFNAMQVKLNELCHSYQRLLYYQVKSSQFFFKKRKFRFLASEKEVEFNVVVSSNFHCTIAKSYGTQYAWNKP